MRFLIAVGMLIAIAGLWQYNKNLSAQSEKAAIAAQNHRPFKPFDARPVRRPTSPAGSIASQPAPTAAVSASANPQFKCDGRTHCSQMRSCAEATFFLQHCPNTQMDGNNDGEPCEQQWCN